MQHHLRYGDNVHDLRRMAKNSGGKVSVPDPPALTERQHRLSQAFATLSTCRRFHMGGEGPIPWTAVRDYAREYGFDVASLTAIIMEVDSAYLEHRMKSSGVPQDTTRVRRGASPTRRKARARRQSR